MPKHPEPRQSVVASLLPSLRERFPSANRALEHLRSIGLGIRRQTFLEMWRAGAQDFRRSTGIRHVRMDATPGMRSYGERYFGRPYRYTYLVSYRATNVDTGQTENRWSYIHTDLRTVKRDMVEGLTDLVQSILRLKGSERWIAGDLSISKAWRNPYALPE